MANIAIIPYAVTTAAEVDFTWSTAKAKSEGGITGRKALHSVPIRNFHVGIPPDQVPEVRAIYLSLDGPRYPVGVRDWSDYTFSDEVLTYAVGATDTLALLSKKFTPATGARAYSQRILMPDQAEVALTIKVNGSILSALNWTLVDFGKIQIPNAHVPGGATITASGRFVYPCCFLEDSLTMTVHGPALLSLDKAAFEEILETELINLTA